jgi:hypothetical protein
MCMQKKKPIPPEEKERIDSLDIPSMENEEDNALTREEEAEKNDPDNPEQEEEFVWEPGREPNQRED